VKHLTTIALMLALGIASAYSQQLAANAPQRPVQMTFAGTGAASTIDLKQPNSTTSEELLTGSSALGTFTFRMVKATSNTAQPSGTCAAAYFPDMAGAGVFSFQDGSMLSVTLTQGGDCIDFVQKVAHCTSIFKITGGTGRFKSASGILTLTETAQSVASDVSGLPVFFSEAGEFTGTISGAATEDVPDARL